MFDWNVEIAAKFAHHFNQTVLLRPPAMENPTRAMKVLEKVQMISRWLLSQNQGSSAVYRRPIPKRSDDCTPVYQNSEVVEIIAQLTAASDTSQLQESRSVSEGNEGHGVTQGESEVDDDGLNCHAVKAVRESAASEISRDSEITAL